MDLLDWNCFGKRRNNNHLEADANPINNYAEALMPIGPTDTHYNMGHKSRGLLLIFNHESYKKTTNQNPRNASNKDVDKITKSFEKLDFEIHPYHDLTLKEIRSVIKYVADKDHSRNDCLAIFILTHGDKDILYAKDACYNPDTEIWGQLSSEKCPSLAGKPKLIFLQACQGSKVDPGITLVTPKTRTQFDGAFSYIMPVMADFLIYYATFEGYYAFRNNQAGSFWVTLLCEELEKHYEKTDLLTILTSVNRRMAVEFSSYNLKDSTRHEKREIPFFKSSMTRLLTFGKKN